MRRKAIALGATCGALFLGFLPIYQRPLVITIYIPGWYQLAGLCVGLWGLLLMAAYYAPAAREWLASWQAWLDED